MAANLKNLSKIKRTSLRLLGDFDCELLSRGRSPRADRLLRRAFARLGLMPSRRGGPLSRLVSRLGGGLRTRLASLFLLEVQQEVGVRLARVVADVAPVLARLALGRALK